MRAFRPGRLAAGALGAVALFGFNGAPRGAAAVGVRQQGPTVVAENAPPMKYVPAQDRARLAEARDPKERVKLGLEMAEARLTRAEQLTANSDHVSSSAELGIYQAIVEDTMGHLREHGRPVDGKVPNKFRDLFKRLELALRAHGPRIETIRRATPSEEAGNVRAVYDYTREARAEALNSFYGDTVLRESSGQKDKSAGGGGQKDKTPAPEN